MCEAYLLQVPVGNQGIHGELHLSFRMCCSPWALYVGVRAICSLIVVFAEKNWGGLVFWTDADAGLLTGVQDSLDGLASGMRATTWPACEYHSQAM